MPLANAADEPEDKTVSTVDPTEGKVKERPQLEVDLSEDDDGDEGTSEPKEKEGRRERRGRRYRELGEELKQERAARQKLEQQLAEINGRVSGLQSGLQALPRQQAQEESDPLTSEIEGIEAQQDAIVTQLRSGQLPDDKAAELAKRHRQLDRQRRKLELQQFAKETGGGEAAPSRTDYENQMLQTEFPDVFNDPIKLQEAKTELVRLNRTRGLPINYATAKLAAKVVQDKYTRKTAPPTDAERARLAAEPGRAGAGGGGTRFAPNKLQLNAARAYTSHLEGLSDEDRVRIWAKNVGKKHGLI